MNEIFIFKATTKVVDARNIIFDELNVIFDDKDDDESIHFFFFFLRYFI